VLYCVCVLKLCTVISTLSHLDEQLQFSGLGFVTLGQFHCAYCVDIFVLCVFLFHTVCLEAYYCERGGVDLMGLKPNPLEPSFFSDLTLCLGHLTRIPLRPM